MRGKICGADLPKHWDSGECKYLCSWAGPWSEHVSESGQWRTPVAPTAERTQLHDIEWIQTTFSRVVGSLQSLHPSVPPGSTQLVLLDLPYPLSFHPVMSFAWGLCAPCRPNATKWAKAAEALLVATQSELGYSFGVCKDSWPGWQSQISSLPSWLATTVHQQGRSAEEQGFEHQRQHSCLELWLLRQTFSYMSLCVTAWPWHFSEWGPLVAVSDSSILLPESITPDGQAVYSYCPRYTGLVGTGG